MLDLDDHAAMLALAGGRRESLGLLFKRHHVSLFSFFRKLGHSRADAEDLVQETFMRILKYAGSYRTDGSFPAWMYRIARHAAHDAWHARSQFESEDAAIEQTAPRHQEPATIFASAELGARLQQALLRLPREKRELILLSRVQLLGMEDLAALYDCSVAVVKTRLHRSLELLRHLFEESTPAHSRKAEH